MELKKITQVAFFTLPIIATNCFYSIAYAEEESSQNHKTDNSIETDPSTVTLDAMIISSEQPQEAFEAIKLIKKDLGIATDGADVLKKMPGVSVTRQGGTASDPILRGMGGSRLNISIDGVPFGGVCNHRMDPATAYVSPGTFDKLTLLKGPQSVQYGINFAGGSNFSREEIRYEELGARVYGSYRYSSFNQQSLSVDSSVGFEKGYLSYTHNNTSGDNYVNGDGDIVAQTFYDTSNDRGAIGYTPDEDTLIEFSGLRSDGVMGNATIHMDVTKLDRENYSLHFKKENISSWLQKIDFRYDFVAVDHDMDNFTHRSPPLGDDYNLMSQFFQRHFSRIKIISEITPDIEFVTGMDYTHDSYFGKGSGGDPLFSPPPDTSDEPFNHLVDFDKFAAFAEINYQMSEELTWVSGFRVDTLGTDTGTMHKAGEISNIVLTGSNQHRRQTLFSGFLRSEYTFDQLPITATVGYGHAELAADYWQVYSFDGFALDKEKNNQIDIVLSYWGENYSIDLSVFYSHITDMILVKDGDTALNINAQSTGAEIILSYDFNDSISLNGNLAYTHAENITQDTPLPQTPPLEGNISLKYDDDVFYANIETRLVARQSRIQPGFGNVLALDTTPTAGFATASLQLGYTPHPLVKFQFGIDNIFDKTYTEHLNRSAASAAGPAINKLVEPGRAYWGRVTVEFDYPESFK